MATLNPGAGDHICLDLTYALTEQGGEDYVAEVASDPPTRFTLTIDFSELNPELRRRAYRLYQRQRAGIDDIPFGYPPPLDTYPQLSRPSDDPAVVIAAWEEFHEKRAAIDAKDAEQHHIQELILEGKRQSFRTEMARWVAEYGSERLKLGLARNYRVATTYVRERAAIEFPAFQVDANGKAKWQERANPTLKALKLESQALECQEKVSSSYKIRIVWLVKDEAGGDAKREAVVVPEYLLLYNLIGDPEPPKFDPDEIPF